MGKQSSKAQRKKTNMKLAIISDTHRCHAEYESTLISADADLLIHAGDSDCFDERTTFSFLSWCRKVSSSFRYGSLITFGNHDAFVQENLSEIRRFLEGSNVRIVINESIEIANHRFWASPYSLPHGQNWSAFTASESDLEKLWMQIPLNTDILVTHCPAFGVLDNSYGSHSLAARVSRLQNLKVHIFGHIHESHGVSMNGNLTSINAASIGTIDHGPWHPIWAEIDSEKGVRVQPPSVFI